MERINWSKKFILHQIFLSLLFISKLLPVFTFERLQCKEIILTLMKNQLENLMCLYVLRCPESALPIASVRPWMVKKLLKNRIRLFSNVCLIQVKLFNALLKPVFWRKRNFDTWLLKWKIVHWCFPFSCKCNATQVSVDTLLDVLFYILFFFLSLLSENRFKNEFITLPPSKILKL